MSSKVDTLTVGACVLALGGAMLACKKNDEPEPAATVSAAPAPEPPKEPPKEEPKKDEVKRYDNEVEEKGTVRVAIFEAKIYKEADNTLEPIARVSKGTLVNRLARRGNYLLIEYPSGPGELKPGWVETKHLTAQVLKIDPNKVKQQDAGAVTTPPPTPDAGTPTPAADAGPRRRPVIRLPKKGIAPPPGGRPTPGG